MNVESPGFIQLFAKIPYLSSSIQIKFSIFENGH